MCSFWKCAYLSLLQNRQTLTERLNGTANTRGIIEKKSRRALGCIGDDKESIKLLGGGGFSTPLLCSLLTACLSFSWPCLCITLKRVQLWVIPTWTQMLVFDIDENRNFGRDILHLWVYVSFGQLSQEFGVTENTDRVDETTHNHAIWWRMCFD